MSVRIVQIRTKRDHVADRWHWQLLNGSAVVASGRARTHAAAESEAADAYYSFQHRDVPVQIVQRRARQKPKDR
jgi:hypothetical protein